MVDKIGIYTMHVFDQQMGVKHQAICAQPVNLHMSVSDFRERKSR